MAGFGKSSDSTGLLFFILVYLLLFYDSRPLAILCGKHVPSELTANGDNPIPLFFILIYLLLFY